MKTIPLYWLFCVLSLGLLAPVVGAAPVQRDHIEVELVAEARQVVVGEAFWVALRLDPDEHWHTYWRNPGDSGLATAIQWQLPPGSHTGDIQWPHPEKMPFQQLISYGYGGEVFLLTQVTPPAQWPAGEPFPLTAQASWLVCEEICIPGKAELHLEVATGDDTLIDDRWREAFADTRARTPVDAPWQAGFAVTDAGLELQVQAQEGAFAQLRQGIYFPIQTSVVENNAPQRLTWNDQRLVVTQAKSSYFQTTPDTLGGVLVMDTANGTQAVRFTATPGLLAGGGFIGDTPAPGAGFTLAFMLLSALVGGLLLNLMPCVFPVLSLKAMALVGKAHADAKGRRLHGLAYTAGAVVTFVAVAALLLALRASGQQLGWGFQLQSPWFVAALAALMFIMGLCLSGLFQVGGSWVGVGGRLTQNQGYGGSFFTGDLAVVVASPCTPPLMGPAMGFAVTQSSPVALAVFASLGLGMALPFLLLGFVPGLARWLPRPGAWMETFKQFLAFPLYLTALWLLWVLGRQAGVDAMAAAGVGLLSLAFALWLLQHLPANPWGRALGFTTSAAALVAAVGLVALPLMAPSASTDGNAGGIQSATDHGEPFSAPRLAELRASGRPVFVNMTADWCITCKVNEVALDSAEVRRAFRDRGVTYLKGDWTRSDPEITAVLTHFGRSGVPLYVLYPGDPAAEPVLLPQMLTVARVKGALDHL
ncbi:MAG: protein-disulfide reductase DsbD family protein [Candidatus Competibacterales bacterium]